MAGARVKIESVELLQFPDAVERSAAERGLAIEGMQDDAFEYVAERHVVILGKAFQDFENALLHPDTGLDALNEKFRIVDHGTNIPWYLLTVQRKKAASY